MANVFPQLNKNIHRGKLTVFYWIAKTVGKLSSNVENQNVFFIAWAGNETYFEHVYLSSYLI
jgi:uncharacterized circularly permuted ATP-grasp superfamily protein